MPLLSGTPLLNWLWPPSIRGTHRASLAFSSAPAPGHACGAVHVRACAQDPDTSYWYSVGGDDRTLGFRSPLPRGSQQPFTFIAFGDMGESSYKASKSPM